MSVPHVAAISPAESGIVSLPFERFLFHSSQHIVPFCKCSITVWSVPVFHGLVSYFSLSVFLWLALRSAFSHEIPLSFHLMQ